MVGITHQLDAEHDFPFESNPTLLELNRSWNLCLAIRKVVIDFLESQPGKLGNTVAPRAGKYFVSVLPISGLADSHYTRDNQYRNFIDPYQSHKTRNIAGLRANQCTSPVPVEQVGRSTGLGISTNAVIWQ